MVAPNGARLGTAEHPNLPVTIEQTIECAVACKDVGAHALHAHVRDKQQKHLLDSSAYKELLDLAANKLGADFPVQITTEAFGMYTAVEQIALVEALKPRFASVAMREILRDDAHLRSGQQFYQWCVDEGIGVQHILYGDADFQQFQTYQTQGVIPAAHNAVLMVVGRYTDSNVADEDESRSVVSKLATSGFDWMLCAFGKTETQCLVHAASAGGGVRVGFENNLEHVDGTVAVDNAERVNALHDALSNDTNQPIDLARLYKMLGG